MNWLTPQAQVRPVGGKGWGSFASVRIPAGTTVAGFGGFVVTRAVFDDFPEERRSRSIQVDDDLFLMSPVEPEPGDLLNHSCDPTCGLMGATLLVALRDIQPGEELSFDYATCDSADYDEFTCECGTQRCRGQDTGSDWTKPELQARYAGWFSPYLARKIASRQAEELTAEVAAG